MASLDEHQTGQSQKRKRKRVSAKFRRLTKERRQANARERDRANALRTAFLSLEDSLPQELKEQLPTRFGTMLAAILYIGHLTELVCERESPAVEIINRATCRRYQGIAGEGASATATTADGENGNDEESNGEGEVNARERQVELRLVSGCLIRQSAAGQQLRLSSNLSTSASPSPPNSISPLSCDSFSSGSDMSSDQGLGTSHDSSSSILSVLELDGSGGGGKSLAYTPSGLLDCPLFPIPDLGSDDLFSDLFDDPEPFSAAGLCM